MLYLEDYLELIEHLPLELRDRFTDIRERDLQVHNSTEQLLEKVKLFFAEAKKLKPEQRQCEYERLINEYQETMKYADDKVRISTQMYDIMAKLVQRLDTELEKFKLELEADHAGITEELEKRSLQLDADSRLDDMINDQLNGTDSTVVPKSTSLAISQAATKTNKTPSGIKDRRRSEHKHRHHPYQNNQDNGYHGRAKLSNHEQHNSSSKDSPHNPKHPHNNNNNHHQRHGSKSNQNGNGSCRKQSALSPPQLHVPTGNMNSHNNSFSAPGSIAGDLNGFEGNVHYEGSNLTNFKSNSSSKNSGNYQQNIGTSQQLPFNQHSALSAALASTTAPPQLNTVTALAMMNANSVHSKISTTNHNNNMKGSDLIDPNSPLVRQNPIAAAASQAIAATQQLQQGRRTPSLKASFAAINAGGLGPLDSLASPRQQHDAAFAGANRNALAPMAPDQQALSRFTNQFGKMSGNSNGSSSPLYISVTKSGRPTKRPKHHASHLYPDESPTSISSDNSVFKDSESLSSTDYIESGTKFSSTSPSSLDFSSNAAQGNTTLYHRDETKYCVCRQISYGEMVACDNDECEIEWFHYDCVGITQPPKGKWFCPDCTRKMNGHHHQQLHHNNTSIQQQPQTQKKRGRKEKSLFSIVNNSMDAARPKAERGAD